MQTLPAQTRSTLVAREVELERFQLRVAAGPDEGAVAVSASDELSVGTAQGNDLVLTDPTVSRHHCAIASAGGAFALRDLDSTNGTKLGGYRIQLAYLKPGARIAIGRTELVFESLGESVTEPLSAEDRFGPVLGESAAMRRLFALLPKIAESRASVLLEGETGTGKSLVAEAIHELGPRAQGPLIVVDCGAISPSLIESELFGHVRGAFTGADRDREGAFAAARGGTVFLDEIGELPLETQPKLLRVLERHAVTPVGSSRAIDLDVRILAATNRDLRGEVNRRAFRADLYYRLNTIKLRIPPLRDRPEDIPMLVAHFYRQLGKDEAPPAELISRLAKQRLPGNVRELRSAVERAALLGDAPAGGEAAPGDRVAEGETFREAKARAMAAWEREYLRALVAKHASNLSRAARAVGMDRNHLRDLLRRHELDPRAKP
jgi:DNA-binding NtrC family response regulator